MLSSDVFDFYAIYITNNYHTSYYFFQLKEDVLNVGKKIKKNETIVKQQEAPIQLTSLLIQQLYWVTNLNYFKPS